jgi:hypothetical protein
LVDSVSTSLIRSEEKPWRTIWSSLSSPQRISAWTRLTTSDNFIGFSFGVKHFRSCEKHLNAAKLTIFTTLKSFKENKVSKVLITGDLQRKAWKKGA